MLTSTAGAETVARWVDENGVTHFGNPQFAPAHADSVHVREANGMDKPEAPTRLTNPEARTGPATSVITVPPKQNKKGWRPRGESLYTGRKHSANRTYRR
jgi:hypothetical protein